MVIKKFDIIMDHFVLYHKVVATFFLLKEERSLHVQTKAKLVNREKELECALAKVTMLSKELETEKKKYREM